MFNEQKRGSVTPLMERMGMRDFLLLADKSQKWPENVDPLQVLREATRYVFAGNTDTRGNMTGNPFKRGN